MVDFELLPPETHEDQEQVKRQKSALDKKLTPISIDKENLSAVFRGSSEDYITTLSSCQCVDFRRRELPCKHMYRLAMELGYFPGLEYTKTMEIKQRPDHRWSVEHVLNLIADLSKDEQIAFGYLCYQCGNENSKGSALAKKELVAKLIELKLVYPDSKARKARINQRVFLVPEIEMDANRIHRAICKLYPEGRQDYRFE